jgi:hypothetical protein
MKNLEVQHILFMREVYLPNLTVLVLIILLIFGEL